MTESASISHFETISEHDFNSEGSSSKDLLVGIFSRAGDNPPRLECLGPKKGSLAHKRMRVRYVRVARASVRASEVAPAASHLAGSISLGIGFCGSKGMSCWILLIKCFNTAAPNQVIAW